MTTHLVDTSVAVPLVVASHRAHTVVVAALGRRQVYLAGHAAIETYSVITRLPGDARVRPEDALRLMRARFAGTVVAKIDPDEAIARLVAVGIAGGAVYDGLVALATAATHQPILYSRDSRAAGTYAKLDTPFRLLV